MILSRIKRSRQTGTLDLSQLDLNELPVEVLQHAYADGENWWETLAVMRLNLAFNDLQRLPPNMFESFLELTHLNLSHNRLETLPSNFDGFSNLKSLDLSHNKLSGVLDLSKLAALTELRINDNLISLLKLLNCSLQVLYASSNSIGALQDISSSLQIADLSNNKLSSLPESVGSLEFLRMLILSGNNLVNLPSFVTRSLLTLELSRNKLSTLPNLNECLSLQTIEANHNRIFRVGDLPPGLLEFSLADNKLTTFPIQLASLYKLAHVDLRNNSINEVTPQILFPGIPTTSIKRLLLDGNPIKTIPRNIIQGPSRLLLEFIANKVPVVNSDQTMIPPDPSVADFSGKNLTHLPNIPETACRFTANNNFLQEIPRKLVLAMSFGRLTKISLVCNRITSIPELFSASLMEMDLTGNRLHSVDLSSFSNCNTLEHLILSMNQIAQLDVNQAKPITGLSALHLNDNRLSTIPDDLKAACPKLNTLALHNNALMGIPSSFGIWKDLLMITVYGNPIRNIPQSVIAQGTPAIKEILARRSSHENETGKTGNKQEDRYSS